MTELKLYKFLENKDMRWNGDELVVWINFWDLVEFTEMIGYDYFSDGGIEVKLQHQCVAFDIVPICEYFEIEPTDMFEKE